jgi:hypothetical protein
MPQTVTVTGVDDAIADDSVAYHVLIEPITSADPSYNGLNPPDVSLINLDNEKPTVQIIDNGSRGFAAAKVWVYYTASGYQSDIHFSAKGTGLDVATWTFDVDPGQYQVSATWSVCWNHATNAPFTVFDGGTSLGTLRLNQEQAPSGFRDAGTWWQDLGGPYVIEGSQLIVRLRDNADEYVIADAVRIERLGPPAALSAEPDGGLQLGPAPSRPEPGILDALVDSAIGYWTALSLFPGTTEPLGGVEVELADLPGRLLGLADGNRVLIDRDGAGYGWFADSTPRDHSEFSPSLDGSYVALVGSKAQGRIDLLTVLAHELGHVMGLDHVDRASDSAHVMLERLQPGVRRLPEPGSADQLFAELGQTS